MVEKPSCDRCKTLLEMYGKEPDCLKCFPSVLPENMAAFKIYNVVEDQILFAGMGEPIALMNEPIWSAIDRFRSVFSVYDDLECFFQVKKIASVVFEKQQENRS